MFPISLVIIMPPSQISTHVYLAASLKTMLIPLQYTADPHNSEKQYAKYYVGVSPMRSAVSTHYLYVCNFLLVPGLGEFMLPKT